MPNVADHIAKAVALNRIADALEALAAHTVPIQARIGHNV